MERGEAAGHVVQGAGAELCQGPPPPVPGEAVVLAALVFAQVVRVLHEGPRHPTQSDIEAFELSATGDAEKGLQEQEPARLIIEGGLRSTLPKDDFGAFEVPGCLGRVATQLDLLC